MVGPYPWLVHSHGINNRTQTLSTITSPNDAHLRRFPHSKHKKFWVSCNDGWSLSSDANHRNFFLWNIVELKKITLPPLVTNFRNSISHCILTSPPTKPDCMILLSTTVLPLIFCLRLGDQQWTKINYENEVIKCLRDSGEIRGPVEWFVPLRIFSCNGDLYALTKTSKLLLIEKLELNHGVIVLKSLRLSFPRVPFVEAEVKRFLAEFEGKIYWILFRFGVKENEEVVDVDIHGLDLSKMVWEKVEHVPNLAFFVHETCSFCCRVIEPEIHGNRIYFSSNKILYSYNIGDKTLSADSRPLPNIESPYSSFWVMPDQRLCSIRKVKVKGRSEISNVAVRKLEEKTKNCNRYLPFDVADQIANCVDNFVDLLHLRASHRMFRSIPITLHSKKAIPSPSPWLISQKDGVCSMVDPVYSENYSINLPPLLSTSKVCFSNNSWLLMSGTLAFTFLFNPFTKQIVPFPKQKSIHISTSFMAFSSYPSLDCVAVEINKFPERHFELNYARLRDKTWSRHTFPDRNNQLSWLLKFKFYDNPPVFFQGDFYCLGHCGHLGVLRLRENMASLNFFHLGKPCFYQQNFLVECNGQLLGVFVGKSGKRVRIFRLKRSKNTWIKVESLGNYMIFISRCSSVAAMATIPGMENTIYFPRFCGKTGYDAVFYSLDTNKFHSFQSKDSEVDFYRTRELLNAAWIQPNF